MLSFVLYLFFLKREGRSRLGVDYNRATGRVEGGGREEEEEEDIIKEEEGGDGKKENVKGKETNSNSSLSTPTLYTISWSSLILEFSFSLFVLTLPPVLLTALYYYYIYLANKGLL